MGWDEWERLKAEAARGRSTRLRLDQLAPGAGGAGSPRGDLTVHQNDLAAIGSAAHELFQDSGRFSDHARLSSMTAAGGLKSQGFVLGAALDHVAERWIGQAQTLLDACAHISNHLRYTKNQHAADESHIAGTLSGITELDHGFDERNGS
jgi:hypothetical protein